MLPSFVGAFTLCITDVPGNSTSLKDSYSLHIAFFCAVFEHAGKADLSQGYLNSKWKLWATKQFSEITKEQNGKRALLLCI